MNPSPNMDTDEYPALASPTDMQSPQTTSAAIQVDLAALSHQGKVRPNNEDHFLVARFHRVQQTLLTNLPEGLLPLQAEEVG